MFYSYHAFIKYFACNMLFWFRIDDKIDVKIMLYIQLDLPFLSKIQNTNYQ